MWKRRALWGAWIVSFGLAVACAIVFLQSVLPDTRAADPALRVDFASGTGSTEARFRIWGEQDFTLLISSVNHDASLVGRPLNARFEIEIADPTGKAVLHEAYSPRETGHRVPSNYGDVRLANLRLKGSPLRKWALRVNVLEPDPAFETTQTHVKLYRMQDDPGMGGLMNYAVMIPGGILLLGALLLSIPLARGGSRGPLLLTLSAGVLVLLIPSLL